MAEKQAPFDFEAQRPNDFVQDQKEENQAAVLKQLKASSFRALSLAPSTPRQCCATSQ
jgi:hypothetical protein